MVAYYAVVYASMTEFLPQAEKRAASSAAMIFGADALMLDAAWHGTKATVLGLGGSVVNTAAAVRHVQRGSFFLIN